MPAATLDELRGRVSAGEYAIDSGEIAGEILTKFALVRKVTRLLMSEGEEPAADESASGAQPRSRTRSQGSNPANSRRERLS